MFIPSKISRGGYDSSGQQFSTGLYLALFSRDRLKVSRSEDCKYWQVVECATGKVLSMFDGGSNQPAHDWIKAHGGYYDLFACVRKVGLKQLGHFMMGSFRIGGQSVTVSGPYGSDGLPLEYDKLNDKARSLLVPVPEDLARQYWSGDGHNDVGGEAPAMRQWALDNLGKLRGNHARA